MSIDTTEHNGWTNYATWRINLEMFDGYELDEEKNQFELEQELRQRVYAYIDEVCDEHIVSGWARAFVDEVDFYMIAKTLIENHKEKA